MEPATNDPLLATLLAETGRMRRLAGALLRDEGDADADDVVQDASLAALTHEVPSGRDRAPWLLRIVRNLSFEALRRRARRRAREAAAAPGVALPATIDVARRLELHRALVAAVSELPEPQRRAVRRLSRGVGNRSHGDELEGEAPARGRRRRHGRGDGVRAHAPRARRRPIASHGRRSARSRGGAGEGAAAVSGRGRRPPPRPRAATGSSRTASPGSAAA
jgi:hypothetical protein